MVRKGDILYNPISRSTITFLLTGADTAGSLLQLDISMAPGGAFYHWPLHLHPLQTETLTIRSGKIWATLNGLKRLYGPGEVVLIPAGVAHQLENGSPQEELSYVCEMRPALATETLYETALSLALAENLQPTEPFPLLQAALTLHKFTNHFYLASCPVWLQKLLFCLLSPVALLLGYKAKADYKEAVSGAKPASLLFG